MPELEAWGGGKAGHLAWRGRQRVALQGQWEESEAGSVAGSLYWDETRVHGLPGGLMALPVNHRLGRLQRWPFFSPLLLSLSPPFPGRKQTASGSAEVSLPVRLAR